MRMPSMVFATARIALAVLLLVGSVVLISAPKPPFTAQDKEFYADANLVNFIRPGLQFRIVSAQIANDGTISARVRVTDPRGLGLDRLGVTTPGTVSMSFVAAYLPSPENKYTAYTTRQQTSPITGATATQAAADAGGRFDQVAEGEYTYTFGTKAPATINRNAVHSILVYGNRNLSEFDLPNNFDDDVYHFIPAGGQPQPSQVRDIIKTETCNKCHRDLAAHGGSRRSLEGCILCHTPQTSDPDTGNTVDMVVMTHRIHAGEELPSVEAGKPYVIIGNAQSVHDFSTVAFPADIQNCQFCHEKPASGQAPAQQNAWMTRPNRAACGACHDNVNFATGEGHANLPQVSDNQCATCHTPQGELPLDLSIVNAHMIPEKNAPRQGLTFDILSVTNTAPGQKPTVTFTMKRDNGQPYTLADFPAGTLNRVALILSGPSHDYGYTSFGSDVTTAGYVSETPTAANATCAGDGTCTYTFTHAIPSDAIGTYSVSLEGRREETLLPGTTKATTFEYNGKPEVFYFGAGSSPTDARRQIVATEKCNQCHSQLTVHGENRSQVEQCAVCHNASETDRARRGTATDASERTKPPQSVDFALMIHKIHTGERMHEFGRSYTVIGFGGSVNAFDEVRYPAMTRSGGTGDTAACEMCHVNGSQNLPLPDEVNRKKVTDPQGPINPAGRITAACTGCHQSNAAASHALANTTQLGESCSACHGTGSQFSVETMHAQ
jgi:OmcA/MtrC family decaheme c-type cytochrome